MMNKNVMMVLSLLLVSLNLFAAEQSGTQNWWRRIAPSRRTAAAVVGVALLAATAKAAVVANNTEPVCAANPVVPLREPSLEMITAYFTLGGECAVRCIAQADWLGPLYAYCADPVGCADMIMQGALSCDVDPAFVAGYECNITQRGLLLP